MGWMDEYNKLKEERLRQEASGKPTGSTGKSSGSSGSIKSSGSSVKSSSGNSWMDEYNTLKSKRKAKEEESSVASRVAARTTYGDKKKKKEEEKERKWFEKGLFEDGYDFGDITRTILGTTTDVLENVGTGIIGMGEKAIDAMAYIAPYAANSQFYQNGGGYNLELQEQHEKVVEQSKKDLGKFIAKDLYDEEAVARAIISDPARKIGVDSETQSVFGEKSDALVQSGGQLLATAGLSAVGMPWWLTTGVTSFGSEAENAMNQGATYEQAGASAAISAGAEVLSEKLSGGISFGGKTLDDALTKQLARGISNKLGRTAAKLGLDMVGEGAEEVFSQMASNLGSSLYKEEDLSELLFNEEAMDGYLESFIGGAVMGGVAGGYNAVKSNSKGVDYTSGLTKNEQKVVDKLYKDGIADKDGKLTQREKAKIYDEIMEDLEKGRISIDTIVEAIGGEKYDQYKQAADWESSLQTEYDTLSKEYDDLGLKENPNLKDQSRYAELKEKIPGLKQRLDNVKATSTVGQMKAQLTNDAYEMSKSDRLVESFFEDVRSHQKYEADLSKYEGRAKEVIKQVMDSGLADNSNQSHEFWDMVAKVAVDRDTNVSLVDNDQMMELVKKDIEASGKTFDPSKFEGKIVDGIITEDGIAINAKTKRALNFVVGHEITHSLEKAKSYGKLQEILFKYDQNGYEARFKERAGQYENIYSDEDYKAKIDKEVTADMVGDFLFTDKDFIKHLSTENRNVFQKMWDEVKYLCKVATAGSKQARELEKVKKTFEQVWREGAAEKNGIETRYSLENKGKGKYNKRSRYSESETLFMSWENGSAPVGEVKKFKRFGKIRYYEKTENGCVELSRSQYNERNGRNAEETYGRIQRQVNGIADPNGTSKRNLSGSMDGDRDAGRTSAVSGQTFGEELRNDISGSASSDGGYTRGNGLTQTEYNNNEASDESGASFITFSNDYAAIRNFMKEEDTGSRYSLGYHAGDLGKAESYFQQGGSRSTGHFGTGTYFVGNKAAIEGYNKRNGKPAPVETVEFDKYNLYKVYDDEMGYKLHDKLHTIDRGFSQDYLNAAVNGKFRASELRSEAWKLGEKYETTEWNDELGFETTTNFYEASIRAMTEVAEANDVEFRTYDEHLEYIGEDVKPGDEDYDLYQDEYYAYLKEILEEADEERNDGYSRFRDAHWDLGWIFGKENVNRALQAVLDHDAVMEQADYDTMSVSDSRATVFMKALGYEGIDVRGTRLDNTTYGSVIYDLKGEDAKRKAEIGTAKYSLSDSDGKQLTKEQQDYFKDSKVRDENGNLKVMYHGSRDAGFHVFDGDFSDDGMSFFFTDRNTVAASYSGTTETYAPRVWKSADDANNFLKEIGYYGGYYGYEVVENNGKFNLITGGEEVATSDNAADLYEEFCDYEGVGYGDANYKVYLNLKNPLEVDAEGRNWDNVSSEFWPELYEQWKTSFTQQEKYYLADLAGWEDFSTFRNEIELSVKDAGKPTADEYTKALSSAYWKNSDMSSLFSMAVDNFSDEVLKAEAIKQLTTRDYAKKAMDGGYDGVIFKNIVDVGAYGGDYTPATVAIAFDSSQIKSVANDKPTTVPDIRYSLSEDSDGRKLSPAVAKRFGNSKVVDENGNLKAVYHGTASGEFFIFDKAKGSVEGDFGSGFYFTDNEADVSEHYEGGGPDFDNKVGRRADEIWGEEPDIEYEEAEERARAELFKGSHKFEVYLNVENPAIVGETRLFDGESYLEQYNEEDYDDYDDYIADVEQLVADDIENIVWEVEKNVDVNSVDGLSDILFEAYYEGGIGIEELKAKINNLYLEDSNGNLVGNEVARQIIESLGFDGIIDPTVAGKWNMDIEEGTTHYIVFKPNQIKAVTNQNPTDNPDIRKSISNVGQEHKRYGNWNVYAKDILLDKGDIAPTISETENVAPVGDVSVTTAPEPEAPVTADDMSALFPNNAVPVQEELEQLIYERDQIYGALEVAVERGTATEVGELAKEYEELNARIRALEGEETARTESITDEDAPVEMDAPFYGESEDAPVDNPFEDRDWYKVGNQKVKAYMYENPEVKPFFQAEAQNLLGELSDTQKGERWYNDQLHYDSGGEQGFGGQKRLTSDSIATLLDDWGMSYADIEKGLNAIIEDNGAENIAAAKKIEFMLNDRLFNGYKNFYDNRYVQPNQDYIRLIKEKQINTYSSELFDSFMANADDYAPTSEEFYAPILNSDPRYEQTAPVYDLPGGQQTYIPTKATYDAMPTDDIAPLFDATGKKGVPDGQQAFMPEAGVEESRAARRRAKMDEHTKRWESIIGDTTTWKDMSLGLSYKTKTLRRILRKVVKDANGDPDIHKADQIYDELETKYDHHEAQLKMESQKLKEPFFDLDLNHVEDYYAHMLGELRYNPDTKLTEEVVKEYYDKHKGRIDTQKVNKAIMEARKTFDDLLVRVNNVLREQGMKEIPYRKGYFPHFTNPKQGWLAKLLNWKTIDNEIPTSIAGLTEMFTPQRSWQSFNKQRMGDKTDYSLYQGLDTYIHGALDWIYHIDDLQSRRALENYIRYTHSDEGVQKRIEEIKANKSYDADEAQKLIEGILAEANNPLSGLVRELMNRTNTLANKKSSMDRSMEDHTNRKVYSTMTNLNSRINANQVVGSFSSALTNFIPMVQSWHEVSPYFTVRGLGDMVRSTIVDDGMVEKSDFLTNRLVEEEKLYQTAWDKVSDKAAFMMNVIDNITSQTVWRSKYLQNIKEGMSEAMAIKNADQFAKNLIAGRSRGNTPTIFDAKNPLAKIFTSFQLEVANQYGYMFEDVPQDSKNVARLVKGYATAFLGAYAYNALYSSLVGRDAAFDPIGIIEDLIKGLLDDEEEPEDLILDTTKNIIEEVPFVGGLIGGGRIPISSAFPYSGYTTPFESMLNDVSEKNFDNLSKELFKPLYYLAMPVAGGQIKKTVEGLSMFSDDHPIAGSYTTSGNLRFPVEDTIGNRIKAGLFGQYASENARKYFDEERKTLKPEEAEILAGLDIPVEEYWEYRDKYAEYQSFRNQLWDAAKTDDATAEDTVKSRYISVVNSELNDLYKQQKEIASGNSENKQSEMRKLQNKMEKLISDSKYAERKTIVSGIYAEVGDRRFNYNADKDFWYEIKPKNSDGSSNKFYQMEQKVTKAFGISYADYWNNKDEYDYAYEKPKKYALTQAVGGYHSYKRYTSEIYDIKADKDKYGKSISGSRKSKIIDYINAQSDLDYGERIILFKSEYTADDTYNDEIVDYLNARDDISPQEMKSILEELGATIDSKGYIKW